MALEADADATEAMAAYARLDPREATYEDAVRLYVELSPTDAGSEGTYRAQKRHNDGAYAYAIGMTPESLVNAIGDLAVEQEENRQTTQTERTRSAGDPSIGVGPTAGFVGWPQVANCGSSSYEYILVVAAVRNSPVAILFAVPRVHLLGPPIVLGRIWHDARREETVDLPGDLSLPPSSIPMPSLRPYAAMIPVILRTATESITLSPDNASKRMRYVNVLSHIANRLERPRSIGELPPEVASLLVGSPYDLFYAWFNECQLITLLDIALGQNAASSTSAALHRRRAVSAPSEPFEGHGDNANHDEDDAHKGGTDGRSTRRRITSTQQRMSLGPRSTPNQLAAIARTTLIASQKAIDWDALPYDLVDPIAVDTWQAACATFRPRGPAATRVADLPQVARLWGIEPTDAETEMPQLLCGRLADEAVTRAFAHGRSLLPDVVARIGVPVLTDNEKSTIDHVCKAPPNRPFLEHFHKRHITQQVARAMRAIREHNLGPLTPEESHLVNAAETLLKEASARYGVGAMSGYPFTSPITFDDQATLAIAALRSGMALKPDDLRDAGSACEALTPLAALYP